MLCRLVVLGLEALMPGGHRVWLDAVLAEAEAVEPGWPRRLWLAGVLPVVARSLLLRLFTDLAVLPLALAAGLLMAYVDLNSDTRWPGALLTLAFTSGFAFGFPRFAWRWAFAVTLVLSFAVEIGFEGPYAADRLDVHYKLPWAVLVAFVVAWLRAGWDGWRRRLS